MFLAGVFCHCCYCCFLLLLLFHVVAAAVAVDVDIVVAVAVAACVDAAVAIAAANFARWIPKRTDFGSTWDRAGGRRQDPPMWRMIRGRRPQQRSVLGGIAKITKPLFLLRQIANFGLGCDFNGMQYRL